MLLLTLYCQHEGGGWPQCGNNALPSKSSKNTGACPSAGAEHADSASSTMNAMQRLLEFHLREWCGENTFSRRKVTWPPSNLPDLLILSTILFAEGNHSRVAPRQITKSPNLISPVWIREILRQPSDQA